jgi:hypothetical protein
MFVTTDLPTLFLMRTDQKTSLQCIYLFPVFSSKKNCSDTFLQQLSQTKVPTVIINFPPYNHSPCDFLSPEIISHANLLSAAVYKTPLRTKLYKSSPTAPLVTTTTSTADAVPSPAIILFYIRRKHVATNVKTDYE